MVCIHLAELGMAEFLLNTLWLLVSASLLSSLSRLHLGSRTRLAQAFIALACICVLLFPVVSATDDLCAGQFVAEDNSTIKKFTAFSRAVNLHSTCFAAHTASQFRSAPEWGSFGILTPASTKVITMLAPSVDGRAPPVV